jgi:hypothetical protein
MRELTVVGGGLAGLVAAIEGAEAGAKVRLFEAKSRVGGRAETTPPPYIANLGPHALYRGTTSWAWLKARRLHRPSHMARSFAIRFRWRGEARRLPPRELWPLVRLRGRSAPVDRDFRSWVADEFGPEHAEPLSSAAGVFTFDHDPGRLSAAFVTEKVQRVALKAIPVTRYPVGGFSAMAERLASYALSLGVSIETSAQVDSLDSVRRGPVVVATQPSAARRLLDDHALRVESPRVALVDVGVRRKRSDPYLVSDLDEAAFVSRAGASTPSHAPAGHDLIQAGVGLRPGEQSEQGYARLDAIFDVAFADWRERLTWRRELTVEESTGTLDLPGSTWRDRTPIRYSDGVWLAGDWVAAPGHFSEVAWNSAIASVREALGTSTGRPVDGRRQ